MIYYNDNDAFAAAWMRELIKDGLLPTGVVDQADIRDVSPGDLDGYEQVHLFAGIGGWPYALRLAGWPGGWPVWTGSCPCQPYSCAGSGGGVEDERHLWPVMRWLIAQRGPSVVFGEQVASADGRDWFAGVRTDLEAMGYAVGGADLCAAGVGAPHIRQRLYWVAFAESERFNREGVDCSASSQINRSGGSFGRSRVSGGSRLEGLAWDGDGSGESRWIEAEEVGSSSETSDSFWGRWRVEKNSIGQNKRVPTEPSLFPLADGVSNRVGLLRGAGNAIVPQVAAVFVRSFLDYLGAFYGSSSSKAGD